MQSPAAGLPLTFSLKRINGKPLPSFIDLTPSQDGLSLQLAIFPINAAKDVGTWDKLYVEVSGGGAIG